jgi:Glycolipid transfer protein (GLTP)
LWTQRQLQYQIAVFDNLLLIPSEFVSAKDAVNAAYKSTYDLYHGFIIKQMFQGSFDAAPQVSVILNHMNIGRATNTASNNDMDDITISTSQSESSSSQEASSVSSEGPEAIPTNINTAVNETKNPLDVVASHVTNEWMKIERFLKQCSGQQRNSQSRNLLVIPEVDDDDVVMVSEDKPKRDSFAVTGPPTSKQTSEEEIPAFVAVVQPMLTELKALIIKLNMNDPSKC